MRPSQCTGDAELHEVSLTRDTRSRLVLSEGYDVLNNQNKTTLAERSIKLYRCRSREPRSMTKRVYLVLKLGKKRQHLLRAPVIIILLGAVMLWMSEDTQPPITGTC
jgi:hypothetical protein